MPKDAYPLACFVMLMLGLSIAAASLSLVPRALYLEWVIAGVAIVVHLRVAPGLPRTLTGNIRRILQAHIWPVYVGR